jgi:hypothetical protein
MMRLFFFKRPGQFNIFMMSNDECRIMNVEYRTPNDEYRMRDGELGKLVYPASKFNISHVFNAASCSAFFLLFP